METLEQTIRKIVNEAEINHEPLQIETCGCISTDETAVVCPEHYDKMRQNSLNNY